MSAAEPRSQRITLIAAVAIVALLALFATSSGPETTREVRPSTFRVGTGGAKALYLVAEELGLAPQRWMKPFRRLGELPPRGVVAILGPGVELDDEDAGALLAWVDAGGRAIHAPLSRDALVAAIDLSGPEGPVALSEAEHSAAFERADARSELASLLLADVAQPLHGLGRVFSAFPAGFADADAGVEPLLVGPGRSVGAALVRRGEGAILLLADPGAITNGRLGEVGGVAPFVVRALALLRGDGPLLFDEFHHGYDEEGGVVAATLRWLAGAPPGRALLALAAVGLLALVGAGVRLGAPLPRPRRAPRSALEHVEALARAWDRARAERRPKELLLEGLRLRLGADADAALAPVATAPGTRLAAAVELVEAARQESRRPARGGVDPIELARAVDAILAELRPGAPVEPHSPLARERERAGTR